MPPGSRPARPGAALPERARGAPRQPPARAARTGAWGRRGGAAGSAPLGRTDANAMSQRRAGEIEVIVLGQQQAADWVLIDNEHARKAARQVGLPLKGTVGLLLEGWRQGHLSLQAFELLLQEMKNRPDLWISEQLCNHVLRQARQEAAQRHQY